LRFQKKREAVASSAMLLRPAIKSGRSGPSKFQIKFLFLIANENESAPLRRIEGCLKTSARQPMFSPETTCVGASTSHKVRWLKQGELFVLHIGAAWQFHRADRHSRCAPQTAEVAYKISGAVNPTEFSIAEIQSMALHHRDDSVVPTRLINSCCLR
jgi:hypothetical protein